MAETIQLRDRWRIVSESDPLLATKLAPPPARLDLVRRPHLVERLNEAVRLKLTLISAPAGFGKTTLLAEWRTSPPTRKLPTAWLALDERDDDSARFWTYVIGALDGISADVGRGAQALLQSPQPPPVEMMLTVLVNALAAVPFDFALVLDDYHLIGAKSIHQSLSFLLDHMPPQMHLILATRADPPVALARLRARGQLTELRAGDLRFTPDEVAAFLGQVMGMRLPAVDVAALETRTEGWIAGLQLAALSMRGRDDVFGFIAAFTGSHRHILDYLTEEVLARQPEDVESFLLQTCILDRLAAPLCDAMTGRSDGQAMLERVERDNLFLLALDEARGWYRYHHLFADALRTRLQQTQPAMVSALHARAAEWHEHNGSRDEAVRHALAAGDFERAARLLEHEAGEMLLRGQGASLRAAIEALPAAYVRARPWLSLSAAWALLFAGQVDAVEPRLREVEGMAGAIERGDDGHAGESDAGQDARGDMLGGVALARAALAAMQTDAPRTIEMCQQALAYLPEGSMVLRGLAAGYLGTAYWLTGDVEAAGNAVNEAIALSRQAGNAYYALTTTSLLGQLRMAQGRLREAATAYEQALHLAAQEYGEIPSVAPAHVGLSDVLLEWNELGGAERHAQQAITLGRQGGDLSTLILGYLTLARVKSALRDRDGSLAALDEVERVAQHSTLPAYVAGGIAAWRARLALSFDDSAAAAGWARQLEWSTQPTAVWLGDIESITLARVLVALGRLDEAMAALERLRSEAETGGRTGSVIECLALVALVAQARGNSDEALASLRRALVLAEPHGYVRVFIGQGAAMARLLAKLLEVEQRWRGSWEAAASASYIRRLLGAFDPAFEQAARGPAAAPTHGEAQTLIEPLSGRELEVLRLIASGASNRDIARELIVSLGTVKKHLNNIFGKLDAHSRTQAVARARQLGLLPD